MAKTWITDMRHYLDGSGVLVDMPAPSLSLALFLGAIVAWVTSNRGADARTNVRCRWRSGRRRCPGEIEASLASDGVAISWRCPVCGDNGVMRGWEGTRWDRRTAAGR